MNSLDLKAGDWVEVRSRDEILATLDPRGCLENLPFMPEMLKCCGLKFQVFKRADKTCDNIGPWSIRRLRNSVHLRDVRCAGTGHDGCEAGCLVFWKEAWLKRAEKDKVPAESLMPATVRAAGRNVCTVDSILAASRTITASGEATYFCQATEVPKFTSFMPWWSPGQYIRDIRSGNLATGLTTGAARSCGWLEVILAVLASFRHLLIGLFNQLQARRGVRYPPLLRGPQLRTPIEFLDLQPGELVEVRSKEEIESTLDQGSKNRGLYFSPEMLHYSGGIYRVLRRVNRIVDEKTCKMLDMKYPCIVLQNVSCQSAYYHRFCPRAIYHYWREGWLRRVKEADLAAESADVAETCRSRC